MTSWNEISLKFPPRNEELVAPLMGLELTSPRCTSLRAYMYSNEGVASPEVIAKSLWYPYLDSVLVLIARVGLRGGGQRGQLPRAPRCKGPPVMKLLCFKENTRWKNFCESEAIQEYNSTIIFLYVALSIRGPQQQLYSLQL